MLACQCGAWHLPAVPGPGATRALPARVLPVPPGFPAVLAADGVHLPAGRCGAFHAPVCPCPSLFPDAAPVTALRSLTARRAAHGERVKPRLTGCRPGNPRFFTGQFLPV